MVQIDKDMVRHSFLVVNNWLIRGEEFASQVNKWSNSWEISGIKGSNQGYQKCLQYASWLSTDMVIIQYIFQKLVNHDLDILLKQKWNMST